MDPWEHCCWCCFEFHFLICFCTTGNALNYLSFCLISYSLLNEWSWNLYLKWRFVIFFNWLNLYVNIQSCFVSKIGPCIFRYCCTSQPENDENYILHECLVNSLAHSVNSPLHSNECLQSIINEVIHWWMHYFLRGLQGAELMFWKCPTWIFFKE